MATLLLSAGGQFLGGALGGPLGAVVGRALGALAGNALDQQIFGQHKQDVGAVSYLLGSKEGAPIPRFWGWNKIVGNIIWATELERSNETGAGAKGLGGAREDAVLANFAIALCEGEIAHVGRIWADGQLMDMREVACRQYLGTRDQMPDSLIEAKQGAGNAPAFRGTAYLVFERLDLTPFGNRIPQIQVEICRPAGDLEERTRAICLIPGATEFGYDPLPRVRVISEGEVRSENSHLFAGLSDWEVSLNELQALCPNLEHVALVVSWFGNDLRCGECSVAPRVMGHDRHIKDVEWRVAGLARNEAQICTEVDGGPAYGGTPSDASLIAAIKDLKQRGLKVTIYPLMMMDIPHDNALPNPYDVAGTQPSYPWRGRITCHPAIGQAGTVDQTANAGAQIANFVGTCGASDFSVAGETPQYAGAAEWSYRRFILHCANLARAAGGIDAFIVGSEMSALSIVRDHSGAFPFVDALKAIAGAARQILGAETKLTYAADWSEYHGYQPADAPGDKHFHLDPLWADANIDAIGIDNYMPLGDWRDAGDNLDETNSDILHDVGFLNSQIAGGEGFDWFYASAADRENQIRTSITDGTHGEPWVWRYKDLVSWWQNPHHNRIAGARAATPTDWVPESKPIWFTELGCAAVELGPNEPNAFPDPKSVENRSPYFSSGGQEPSIQRQFLRAHYEHWQSAGTLFDATQNPNSGLYAGKMLDEDRTYIWAWDARPFPAFPLRDDVWSDAPSYHTGHWTTGRFGCATAAEFIKRVAEETGVEIQQSDSSICFVEGAGAGRTMSVRDQVELLLETDDLLLLDRPEGLRLVRIKPHIAHQIDPMELVWVGEPLLQKSHRDASEDIKRLNLGFRDRLANYDQTTIFASKEDGEGSVEDIHLPLTLARSGAMRIAQNQLSQNQHQMVSLKFALASSEIHLEVGDVVQLGVDTDKYAIVAIEDDIYRNLEAVKLAQGGSVATNVAPMPAMPPTAPSSLSPIIVAGELPSTNADVHQFTRFVAGYSAPWPAHVEVRDHSSQQGAVLENAARVGALQRALPAAAQFAQFDRKTKLIVQMKTGHLSSVAEKSFAHSNRLLVQNVCGAWEEMFFATARLVAPGTYELADLMRGLGGTEYAAALGAEAGARVVIKSDVATWPANLGADQLEINYSGLTQTQTQLGGEGQDALRLPAPVHLRAVALANGDVALSWIRRGRVNADQWSAGDIALEGDFEDFRLRIFDGTTMAREFALPAANLTYSLAQQTEDFGGAASSFSFDVAQISHVHGIGHVAQGRYN